MLSTDIRKVKKTRETLELPGIFVTRNSYVHCMIKISAELSSSVLKLERSLAASQLTEEGHKT